MSESLTSVYEFLLCIFYNVQFDVGPSSSGTLVLRLKVRLEVRDHYSRRVFTLFWFQAEDLGIKPGCYTFIW